MLTKKQNKFINNLPIYKYEEEIIEKLKNDNVLILVGETGCGKTTQVPQILLKHGLNKDKCIVVTQPRRVAAISIAFRVASEVNNLT
jgi:HrpA-like RNA helicase